MANMSNYLESGLINWLLRSNTNNFTRPAGLFIALCSGIPDDNSTGATLPELPNAGSYARKEIGTAGTPVNGNWTEIVQTGAGSGLTQNVNTLSFTAATADWGYASGVAIVDSGVYGAGNVLFWGPLATARDIKSGDTFQYSAGNFQINFN